MRSYRACLLMVFLALFCGTTGRANNRCESVFTAKSPRIFFSNARDGQRITYAFMIEKLKRERGVQAGFLPAKKIAAVSFAKFFRPGDVLVYNIYSGNYKLRLSLDLLLRRGVTVLVDSEVTSANHQPVLEQMKDYAGTHSPIVASTSYVQNELRRLHPTHPTILLPHMEQIMMGQIRDEASLGLKPSSENLRVLVVAQPHPEGDAYLNSLLATGLYKSLGDSVEWVVAMHPHTIPATIQQYQKDYPDVLFIQSGRDLKTNELFPLVDGVISHSSTLADIAAQIGVPALNSPNLNRDSLQGFVQSLDRADRKNRAEKLQHQAQTAFNEWADLILGKTDLPPPPP